MSDRRRYRMINGEVYCMAARDYNCLEEDEYQLERTVAALKRSVRDLWICVITLSVISGFLTAAVLMERMRP